MASSYWNNVRNVVKCLAAYFLASLCVYIPVIDNVLGSTDSKHVIATVAVYFHPARSKGSMYEMLMYVVVSIAFLFSVLMACRILLTVLFTHGNDELSHVMDIVVSLGALGMISMMKQSFPRANTACLLALLCVIACIVKEGSMNSAQIPLKRVELTFMVVVTGCAISVIVCYALWPVSAVDELRRHLNDSYDIMLDILHGVSMEFIEGSDELGCRRDEPFDTNQRTIGKGRGDIGEFDQEVQSRDDEGLWFPIGERLNTRKRLQTPMFSPIEEEDDTQALEDSEANDDWNVSKGTNSKDQDNMEGLSSKTVDSKGQNLESSKNIAQKTVDSKRPDDSLQDSLNQNNSNGLNSNGLNFDVSKLLNHPKLKTLDETSPLLPPKVDFSLLTKNIENLLRSTQEARYELLVKGRESEYNVFSKLTESTIALSRHLQALRSSSQMRSRLLHPTQSETTLISSFSEARARVGSHARIHVLFEMFVETLAPSMKSLIFTIQGIMGEVPFENTVVDTGRFAETTHLQRSLLGAIALYEAKQEQLFEKLYAKIQNEGQGADYLTDMEEVTACCGNFASILGLYAAGLLEFLKLAGTYEEARYERSWLWIRDLKQNIIGKLTNRKPSLPRNPSTLDAALLEFQSQFSGVHVTPRENLQPVRYQVWQALKVLRRTDVQFGIRVGLGAFVISAFAFIPGTRATFANWRIEWALTVYCIMMNKLLGGTTMTVKWRFLGTGMGALAAYVVWTVTDGNVFALALTGLAISLPSFRIILYWKKNNPFGRFILLTYNLTALYSYSMREQDNEDSDEGGSDPIVGEIAFHRFVAVSIGIIWALVMASCFLPNSARVRLKSALTVLWLRLGVIWNSDPLDYEPVLLTLIGLKDEKGLGQLFAECETLLKQAPLEFRLKGSFPEDSYRRLLRSTSAIIDALQNMNLMIQVDPVLSPNEHKVLVHIEQERQEVEHRIFLVFYMVASAMRMGFPLPRKPASTEHAKDRMLWKLGEFRRSDMALSNNDFILLYLYILVTTVISEELDVIIGLLVDLLGDVLVDALNLV